jgi:hypothetical protein
MLIVSAVLLWGMIGSAGAEVSPKMSSLNLTPEQWVGHNFLFLDLAADKRAEGYEIFTEDQAKRGFRGDRSVRVSYAEHVGKRITVTDVVRYSAGDSREDYVVHFKENDTGKRLVGRTMSGQLEGLVLEADLLQARQQFMGKTVYVKRRILEGAYDPHANMTPMAVTARIGGAVQVLDVYAGIQSREPIWLIVLVNGQKAILPIAYSWTNMPVNAWTGNPPWEDDLFTEDPRAKLGWSEALWRQIESCIVQEGMTKDQVRLSWGPPVFIDNNTSGSSKAIWNYGTQVLRFTGDNLTAMETVELKNVVIP